MTHQTLGEKLRTLRQAHALTQTALAQRLRTHHVAVSQQLISLYERDKTQPSPTFLRAIADYYRVSLDWLVPRNTPRCGRTDAPLGTTPPERIA